MKQSRRWIQVTAAENVPLREGRAVEIEGREIALFNLGGRFLAVENRCPHRGGPLADGIVSGGMVVCPMHAWRVSLEDGSICKPSEERACVATWPVRLVEGVVSIQLSPVSAEAAAGCNHTQGVPAAGEWPLVLEGAGG